jgi:hypothetical protein
MRFLKTRGPESVLFKDKGEFILVSGILHTRNISAVFIVWTVNGHLCSIDPATPPLQPFRSARFDGIELWLRRISTERQ